MDVITITGSNNIYFLLNDRCFLDVITGNWLKEMKELKKKKNPMRSNNVKSYAIFLILSPKLAILPIKLFIIIFFHFFFFFDFFLFAT